MIFIFYSETFFCSITWNVVHCLLDDRSFACVVFFFRFSYFSRLPLRLPLVHLFTFKLNNKTKKKTLKCYAKCLRKKNRPALRILMHFNFSPTSTWTLFLLRFLRLLSLCNFNDGEWLICLTRLCIKICISWNWNCVWFLPLLTTEHFLFFIPGRRRVSLRRNTKLNHCLTSASSHYFSFSKLNLAIPVILLLLLSTTVDVTGKWFNKHSSIVSDISSTWLFPILCLLLIRSNQQTKFTRHASLNILITIRCCCCL